MKKTYLSLLISCSVLFSYAQEATFKRVDKSDKAQEKFETSQVTKKNAIFEQNFES